MKPSLLLALLLSFPALGHAAGVDPDNRSVEAVVEAFRASIVDKDKPRFVKLFLHENTAWQSVTGDANLDKIRETKPQAVKVRVDAKDGHLSFIDDIVASKDREEEKFRNVKVETDGDIASVFFDYSYHSGGKETNHGKEAWHLVRTDQGWKIVSVIWSVNWTP
ncbi:nuclear transport factor 2 family protein [Luteimonas sp. SX5]|uniref:Nuclear transport factor 2 family protein n=1 Tax=Luteimonas galliterrae TaxID=2940486 RepID=A0ABT0MMM9_9GAMM|nr:nuclear transport factor 2 family protein [Luteimonas galliterrae]MCL1636136.1 nuclear transport factor 2 family protein [Luteimonas galliterrae]